LRAGDVAFGQLEGFQTAVAGSDLLIGRGNRLRWQAGFVICPILVAKPVQASVSGLEEGDDRRQIIGAADAIGDVITAARVGPAGVSFPSPLASSTIWVRRSGPPRALRLILSGKRTS